MFLFFKSVYSCIGAKATVIVRGIIAEKADLYMYV